jgi:hypothetical protein
MEQFDIEECAARLRDCRKRAQALTQLGDVYAERLRQALGESHKGLHGNVEVLITVPRAFDPATAMEVLDPEEVDACVRRTLDPKLVKAVLTPERWERCRTPSGKARVTVR